MSCERLAVSNEVELSGKTASSLFLWKLFFRFRVEKSFSFITPVLLVNGKGYSSHNYRMQGQD
jgi:hypothetical protein